MRYRANTAIIEAYLELVPDGKIESGFFVGDPRGLDNFIFFALAFSVVGFPIVGKSRCQGLPQATSEAGDKRSAVVLDSNSDADRLHSNSNRKAILVCLIFKLKYVAKITSFVLSFSIRRLSDFFLTKVFCISLSKLRVFR